MDIQANQITAIIGPSGCGKSTLLRSINRMNDLVPNVRTEGQIILNGENIIWSRCGCGRCSPPSWDGIPTPQSFPQEYL